METTVNRPSRASRALDTDQANSHPQTASHLRGRAERAGLSPHDPIPLFLSDPQGAPDPHEFTHFAARSHIGIATQIVAGVLGASAIAVLVALFQSDISRLIVLNAKASIGALAANDSAPPPLVRPAPLKDPARVSGPMLASAGANVAPPPDAPSREAIATAYQAALQTQTPAAVPAAPIVTASPRVTPAKTLDADTLSGLMTRARALLAIGDIAAARLLLERAANAQDASAAFLLGQTYDPTVLGTNDTRSITADATAARDWYQRAAQLGSAEARQRLAQFQN